MARKRTYRRVKVNAISMESLREVAELKGREGADVGLDIAKAEIVGVIRWPDGSFERPFSVANPGEIGELIELLRLLEEWCGGLKIGLESTGTYGDAVRYAMTEAALNVHRVSGKAVSDYKEIFDGVPSQHDGKDAAMIAELTSYGKGTPWPFVAASESDQRVTRHVIRMDTFRKQAVQWLGRLEGLLAEHWPELTSFLKLSSATVLNICAHYGSPANLAADESAKQQLRKWGRSMLRPRKIDAIVESAQTTAGIPVGTEQLVWIKEVASYALSALKEVQVSEKALQACARSNASLKPFIEKVGGPTLCVIWATVGDPRKYDSSGAFLKALGLNLTEISSGKRKGRLSISKRGPGLARKYLYFWALRAVQRPQLKEWYDRFQKSRGKDGSSEYRKMKGLVAMMRKLCRALWYACKHDLPFEYAKVFPGRPLQKRTQKRRRRRPVTA